MFPRFTKGPLRRACLCEPDPDHIASTGAEVAFLALPHGIAADIARAMLERNIKVIDLSADFRLSSPEIYEEFYGHPHPATDLLKDAVYGLRKSAPLKSQKQTHRLPWLLPKPVSFCRFFRCSGKTSSTIPPSSQIP